MDESELVPLSEEDQPNGFDVVLRGYDRRQVDDYLDRVEVALGEADQRHADDAQRLAALERQVAEQHERLVDAERRAAGQPEPVPVAGDRIAAMLRLADEEATAIRAAARDEADRLVLEAQTRATEETSTRTKELDQRELELARARDDVDKATLQAQKDAESIRSNAERDAEQTRASAASDADAARVKAEEAVRRMHEAGQREAAAMTAEARRQVEELSRQRDAIAAQLQQLRDTLSGAVAPLAGAGRAPADEPTQAVDVALPADPPDPATPNADQPTQAIAAPGATVRADGS
jgi:DivIVA domain-containing protein